MSPKKKTEVIVVDVENEVTSVSSFMEHVEEIGESWAEKECYRHPWFRGHAEEDWQLLPRLYREKGEPDEGDRRRYFQLRALPYLPRLPKDEWEWYFLMQHYGMKTRLLDWTESALVALYFAVRHARIGKTVKKDAAVWMLDPFAFNKHVSMREEGLFDPFNEIKEFLPSPVDVANLPVRPIAIDPSYNSPRIAAQRGVFTIHGKDKRPIEKFELKGRCKKILISREYLWEILTYLEWAGIRESTVFPDLQGLCNELDVWLP